MAGLGSILAFAETARRGGFAAAARELGLTPSAVAKSVSRLEADLGVRLLHRTTRKVGLTSEGRAFFDRCDRIVAEMQALRDEAAGVRVEPAGLLRINAPVTVGRRWVVPAVARLLERHPRIHVELELTDRYADLAAEGLDAAVRVGQLSDASLVARPVGRQQLVVCASPRYLRAHGRPRRPGDLARHRCMAFRVPSSGRLLPWRFVDGKRAVEWVPEAAFVIDEGEALAAAAEAGAGMVQLPDNMVEDSLERGRLVEVLTTFRPPPTPISVVYLSSRGMTPRLRAFIDALKEAA